MTLEVLLKGAAFPARSTQIAGGSKVLVCSLDPRFVEFAVADAKVYSRHYRHVDTLLVSSIGDLLRAIGKCYDVVHLFCGLSSGGTLIDRDGATLVGSELIAECCKKEVKLLWIANENRGSDYVNGFSATGKPLNLIMTLGRRGERFADFLEGLVRRVSRGETLPVAWASLVPQAQGPWQVDVPDCIFFAGKAAARLLP